MIYDNFKYFPKTGKLIGIDWGAKRIGFAVSDETREFVFTRPVNQDILQLIIDENATGIIIGLPLHLDGTDSYTTKQVREFADKLSKATDIPIIFVEENLTSFAASENMTKKSKTSIDSESAKIILENGIALAHRTQNSEPRTQNFFIQTFGCAMNVYDSDKIAQMLRARGMTQTDIMTDADLIIINTCSVREKATDKVYSALGRVRKRKKPSALFGIVGCVARESGADAFKRIPELNFVLGPQSYHKLPEILDNPDARLLNINLSGLEKFDVLDISTESDAISYIPIQEGCDHVCTYCIVPYTRGREISRPFDDVIRDVKNAAETGAIEICLLGQNVNGYEFNLATLIKETAKLEKIKRIRFLSSYPTEMTDELIDLFRTEPKLIPFVNMPIQSGSANVLTRMNRPYSLELYLEIINKLRKARSDIQISSDFIVGFPGETDEEFNMSCKIARDVKFINSYSYKYSKRPHTAAALMVGQIPENIKKERLKILDEILNENNREFNESCVGRILECLIVGPDKTGKHSLARSPYMQQVVIMNEKFITAQMANVKITDANKSSLRGSRV